MAELIQQGIQAYMENEIQNQALNQMESDFNQMKMKAKKNIDMMDKNIQEAGQRRVNCDLNCMNSRDADPCFNYDLCKKGCIDTYNRDRQKFMKTRDFWDDVLRQMDTRYP